MIQHVFKLDNILCKIPASVQINGKFYLMILFANNM